MALPTLTDFLTSWDKLIVTGMTPGAFDSVMTVAPNGVNVASNTVTKSTHRQVNAVRLRTS